MRSWKDGNGDEWEIQITGFEFGRLKNEADFNICEFLTAENLSSVLQDIEKLVNALWIVSEEQAIERDINEVTFAKLLLGDVLENAVNAFIDASIDFFPPANREKLTRLVQIARKAAAMTEPMLDRYLQTVENGIEEIRKSYFNSSTNSPEFAESIPTGEPIEN